MEQTKAIRCPLQRPLTGYCSGTDKSDAASTSETTFRLLQWNKQKRYCVHLTTFRLLQWSKQKRRCVNLTTFRLLQWNKQKRWCVYLTTFRPLQWNKQKRRCVHLTTFRLPQWNRQKRRYGHFRDHFPATAVESTKATLCPLHRPLTAICRGKASDTTVSTKGSRTLLRHHSHATGVMTSALLWPATVLRSHQRQCSSDSRSAMKMNCDPQPHTYHPGPFPSPPVSRYGLAVWRLAGKQEDLGSIRFGSPFSSLQKLWFMDTVL